MTNDDLEFYVTPYSSSENLCSPLNSAGRIPGWITTTTAARTTRNSSYEAKSKTPPAKKKNCERRVENKAKGSMIGVINVGAQTVAFSVFSTPDFLELGYYCEPLQIFSPQDGWFEIDPMEIIDAVHVCCAQCCSIITGKGYNIDDIESIGLTNQRESTVLWHADTSQPLCRVVAWNDERTIDMTKQMINRLPNKDVNHFRHITGLPVSSQFPALKIKWLQENVPEVKQAIKQGKCKVGTLDSWIIWNLTKGFRHITDVTNASRTMLMNINTLEWEPVLLKTFGINANMLPQIRSNSESYGHICAKNSVLRCKLISGVVGNQQASLIGQMCLKPGQTNCNYRANCFVTCNTGTQQVFSRSGLLTTIAYKMGPKAPIIYALEGMVLAGGQTLEFLQNNICIVPDVSKVEDMAMTVPTVGGVYFVPAFTGLCAPYFCESARGLIIGLTQFSRKEHFVRAALEAICFQVCDVIDSMCKDAGICGCKFYGDGALAKNNILMQLQADLSGAPVLRTKMNDSAAFGAALCAAHAIDVDLSHLDPNNRNSCIPCFDTFVPTIDIQQRSLRYGRWRRAVKRSIGWLSTTQAKVRQSGRRSRKWILGFVPLIIFLIVVLVMFWITDSDEYLEQEQEREFRCPYA